LVSSRECYNKDVSINKPLKYMLWKIIKTKKKIQVKEA
jgi:hypothetical protein